MKYTSSSDRHSVVLVMYHHPNENKVHLALFDSNGKLEPVRIQQGSSTKKEKVIIRIPDYNLQKLVESLQKHLQQQGIHTEYTELMLHHRALNIVGTGHCDAFSLTFIYRNQKATNISDVEKDLDQWIYDFRHSNHQTFVREMNSFLRRK